MIAPDTRSLEVLGTHCRKYPRRCNPAVHTSRGGANSRITPRPHTQQVGGARQWGGVRPGPPPPHPPLVTKNVTMFDHKKRDIGTYKKGCSSNSSTTNNSYTRSRTSSHSQFKSLVSQCLLLALCFATLLPACSIPLAGWITCARNFLAAHSKQSLGDHCDLSQCTPRPPP